MLEDQSLESIVTLLLGAREAGSQASCIILLLIDETSETSVLTLVILNLDLEILGLLCELLRERLEFEELGSLAKDNYFPVGRARAYLLFPAFEFLDKEVIPFRDLAQLGIHTTLEVNEILPGLQCIPRILVAFSNNLIQVSHGYLGHEWFLDCATEDCFHAGVSSLW